MKPSSLLERSVQVRLIWLLDTAVAAKLPGAAGVDGGFTVTLTAVELVVAPKLSVADAVRL
jgi:hypothetical protein